MIKRLCLLIFTLPILPSYTQDVATGFEMGIGCFQMEEIKDFNQFVIEHLPFETKLIDNYPPFYYYHPSILLNWESIEIGVACTFLSSGSRYSAKDYSGEYTYDAKVNASGPSVLVNFYLNPSMQLRFLFTNEIGFLSTKLEMDESLLLGEKYIYDEYIQSRSRDLFWNPGIKLEYPISFFIIEAHARYCMQFPGKGFYKIIEGEKAYLSHTGKEVHPDWSGLRFGLGIMINFSKLTYVEENRDL